MLELSSKCSMVTRWHKRYNTFRVERAIHLRPVSFRQSSDIQSMLWTILTAATRPSDLLENDAQPELSPHSSYIPPTSLFTTALYPQYNLRDTLTTLLLSSTVDQPLQLHNALNLQSRPVASYPLIDGLTEAYLTPRSLAFIDGGRQFVAGTDSCLSVFDVSRSGEGPLSQTRTGPKKGKKHMVKSEGGAVVGFRGEVSTLAVSSSEHDILAAGTLSRHVGLFADSGRGECVAHFSVADAGTAGSNGGGSGITQVTWSPCGRYLYIAERGSSIMQLYDIRVTGRYLACLTGRKAQTQQRMGFDIVPSMEGHEIWAGGTDGMVKVWISPHLRAGDGDFRIKSTFEWRAAEDSVSSVLTHLTGVVVATASGQKHSHPAAEGFYDGEDSDEGTIPGSNSRSSTEQHELLEFDNKLKLWSL